MLGGASPLPLPGALAAGVSTSPPCCSAAGVTSRSKNPIWRCSLPWVVTTVGVALTRAFSLDNDSRICGISPIHVLLLPDAEQARHDEVDVHARGDRDVDHGEDDRHDLLHLLHLRVRGSRGGVPPADLLDLDVLQGDRDEDQQR